MLPCQSPHAPSAMMPISATLTHRAMSALSYRSDSVPDAPEKRKNGAMNNALAIIASDAALTARLLGQPERDQDAEGALQQVVVERTQKLRDEQRREPARGQQLHERRSHGHLS